MPLAIDHPLDVTERLIIRGGADVHVEDNDNVLDSPALHYEQHVRPGRDLVVITTLRATKNAVPVTGVPDHLAALNEIRDSLDITVEPAHKAIAPMTAGTVAVVLVAGLAGSMIFRRRNSWK
jgi:hypothetical protein